VQQLIKFVTIWHCGTQLWQAKGAEMVTADCST